MCLKGIYDFVFGDISISERWSSFPARCIYGTFILGGSPSGLLWVSTIEADCVIVFPHNIRTLRLIIQDTFRKRLLLKLLHVISGSSVSHQRPGWHRRLTILIILVLVSLRLGTFCNWGYTTDIILIIGPRQNRWVTRLDLFVFISYALSYKLFCVVRFALIWR